MTAPRDSGADRLKRRNLRGKAGPVLIGLTPIGWETIIVLEIDLDDRRDLRRGLIEDGVGPPT